MTPDGFRQLEEKIARGEAEILELEAQIRHVRAKVRHHRDCRAMEYGTRIERRKSESSAA